MIFHEFFHYIGLPPQSIDQKRVLWKSIISREKTQVLTIFYKFSEKINEKMIWTHKSGWFFTLIFTVPIRIANSFKKSVLYQICEK